MLCTIVGTRRVDMIGERGEPIVGYSVFLEHDEDGVIGKMAEKTFVNDEWISGHLEGVVPGAGDQYECSFNRRGKIMLDKLIM